MYAKTLKFSGASRIAVLVLAVLIASCEKPSYKIGGTVSGLTGTGLVLRNNGGDNLAISANGAFTFSTQLKKDESYSVTVFAQPSGQTCTVTNGTGTAKGNVTNIGVACAGAATAPSAPNVNAIGFGVKELQFSWSAVGGATSYRLLESPDGGPVFNTVATNITGLTFNYTIPVHRRLNALYEVAACNAGGCTASTSQDVAAGLAQAIGYVKASNTQGADNFGVAAALSADGLTLAIGATGEDSGSTGVNSTPDESAAGAGAVYVFSRVSGAWVQQAYVKASNAGSGDNFGIAVSLSDDGNTLAVGAQGESSGVPGINSVPDEAASSSGAAYVFVRSAG